MQSIRLIHWNAAEAKPRIAALRAAGYAVAFESPIGPATLRDLKESPPAAVVIDLSRLPSHGRDVALALRAQKSTRHIPLVFVGGEPEKIVRIRQLLPDAAFTEWSRICRELKRAIANPPAAPVVPSSRLAGYSGTPLPKKLGIKPDSSVALVGAPQGFRKTLGELPEGARLRAEFRGEEDLAIWFVHSRAELTRGVKPMAAKREQGKLWIAWPKKTSKLVADLGESDVRTAGLGAGLVDYKVCAIDADWSGLLFTRRKAKP